MTGKKRSLRGRTRGKPKAVPSLVWDKDAYPRVAPGKYLAAAVRVQGPEWVASFARWSILVEFELLDDGTRVCAFYNLGSEREKLSLGRRGKYVRDWTLANGEAPHRGEILDPQVFLNGQVYLLQIGDSLENPDARQKQKSQDEMYSRVTEMISVDRPSLHSPNQESRIKQSENQLINQSRKPYLRM